MKNVLTTVLGLIVAGSVWAQDGAKKEAEPKKPEEAAAKAGGELTDPKEILKKADDACKALKSVQYVGSFKGVGDAASQVPSAEGTVILEGWGPTGPSKFKFDVKAQRAGSTDVLEIQAGGDGNRFWVMDKGKKIAYEDLDPAVLGSFTRLLFPLSMNEYVHTTPFSDEMNGENQELKGTVKVGDEDCYEVSLKYANVPQEAHWFFSKKDFLPRRADRIRTTQDGKKITTTQVVTKLIVGPKFEKSPYTLELPEGFTKSEDFAP